MVTFLVQGKTDRGEYRSAFVIVGMLGNTDGDKLLRVSIRCVAMATADAFFVLFVFLVLGVVVGLHARGRGRSGVLWGVAVGLTGLFGLVVYAIVLASAESRPVVCPTCEAENVKSANFCHNCGTDLEDRSGGRSAGGRSDSAELRTFGGAYYCSACSADVDGTPDECPRCGRTFTSIA